MYIGIFPYSYYITITGRGSTKGLPSNGLKLNQRLPKHIKQSLFTKSSATLRRTHFSCQCNLLQHTRKAVMASSSCMRATKTLQKPLLWLCHGQQLGGYSHEHYRTTTDCKNDVPMNTTTTRIILFLITSSAGTAIPLVVLTLRARLAITSCGVGSHPPKRKNWKP